MNKSNGQASKQIKPDSGDKEQPMRPVPLVGQNNFQSDHTDGSPLPGQPTPDAPHPTQTDVMPLVNQKRQDTASSAADPDLKLIKLVKSETQIVAPKDQAKNKKPVKPKEFVMSDEPTQKLLIKNGSELDQAAIRRRQAPAQKRRQNTTSQDQGTSFLKNSNSHQELSIEGLHQTPVTMPLNSPPQTQGAGLSGSMMSNTQQPKNGLMQNTFVQSGFGSSSRHNQEQDQDEDMLLRGIIGHQSRSVGGQITLSALSDTLSKKNVQESTDLDKVTSRHFQDYLMQQPNDLASQSQLVKTEKKPNVFGRNNSVAVNNLSNRKSSKLVSEFQVLKHDFTIEEIKVNHFQTIQKVMDPYLAEKYTAEAVPNLEQQMKKRILPHSYETYKKQQRSISPSEYRRQAGGVAIRAMVNNSNLYIKNEDDRPKVEDMFAKRLEAAQVGRVVNAVTQVKVPKDLILMKIAQRQMEIHQQQFKQERRMSQAPGGSDSSMLTNVNKRRFSLPPMQKEGRTMPLDDNLNQNSSILEIQSQLSHVPLIIQPQTMRHQNSKHSGLLKLINQRSDFKGQSQRDSQSQIDFPGQDTQSETQAPVTGTNLGFHITDLLKQSTSAGQNNMATTIEYYKRSVKTNNELMMEKEIIIKNYRLRVVDARKDITPADRKLMLLNKGTTIYVANSLIKPEIYRYSTKVSDTLAEVYINDLASRSSLPYNQRMPPSNQNIDALTFQDESEIGNLVINHQDQSRGPITPLNNEQLLQQRGRSQLGGNISAQFIPPTASNAQQRERATPFTNKTQTASQQQRVNMTSKQSRGVSSGVYYEQAELQAIMQAQDKVDQWISTAETEVDRGPEVQQIQAYQQVNSNEGRYVLANGQLAPLTSTEIASRMAAPKVAQLVMKPRVMPNEDMTAVTQFSDKPYLNLMRSVTEPHTRQYIQDFMAKTTKYVDQSTLLQTHQNPVVQVIDYQTQLEALHFIRLEFTHLDQHLIQDINLSQDLFFEQDMVNDLIKLLEDRKGDEKIHGKTEFMFVVMGGKYEVQIIDVEVLSYDPSVRTFNLENKELGVVTARSRFNLQLETDPDGFINQNREIIDYWRDVTQQYLRVPRLITTEMLRRYSNHSLSDDMRRVIVKRVGDITKYDRVLVDRVVIQVEALYVYALMKATLSSQRNDPFVKNMLINFHVSMDSPALVIEKQEFKVKENLHPGVMAFRFQAIKNELSKASISVSNGKYMQLPKLLYQITWESIYDKKDNMFITPIPAMTLLQHGDAKFGRLSQRQCNEVVNDYPLDHVVWIEAQHVIQEQFQKMLKTKWAEAIATTIWDFIKGDFEFDTDRGFTENQIDPHLLRIFYQIKSYQGTILYEVFEMGLRSYMRFLLGFAMRDDDIKQSKIIAQIREADQLRLIKDDPNFVTPPDADVNDLELIPMQPKPFVKIHAEIQVTGKMRNRKYKVITVPELDQIQKDFMGVIKNLHDSTRQLKRVDAIVFPLLDLKTPFITQPDIKSNPKMTFIIKLVDKLLEQCMHGCKKKISNFQNYITIFDKKVDGVILELKKQSFALANEGSENGEEEQDPLVQAEEEAAAAAAAAEAKSPVKISKRATPDGGESYDEEEEHDSEDDEEGGGQGGGNMMAYKSVEIDQSLMRQELESIRKHRFNVMEDVSNSYDFGLLYIDCAPFKKSVIDHCLALEEEISNYLKNEFSDKMRNVQQEINALKGRLDENVSSIDDVIALLEYIDTLKRQDNKVEEIADYIDLMKRTADYIESIKVMFSDDTIFRFYHLRNWPRIFDSWLKGRKDQLLQQKEVLIQQMKVECDGVFETVEIFKKAITDLLTKGLRSVTSDQRQKRSKLLEVLFEAMMPDKQTGPVPVEIPREITFQWLANETNWIKHRFDPETVMKMFSKINSLKQQFDDLDKLTVQINKRQKILGIDRTEFREQKKILDELKPLHDLWGIAETFKKLIIEWFEDPLEKLDSQVMENQMEEWGIEMKRIQKAPIIQNNEKQLEMLKFLLDCLAYIKKYQVLIKTTRVKGLNSRHWRQINQELGITIDPQTTTLLRLIGMRLYDEDRIKIIKSISDVAQKEYAIQMQTESLDAEMKSVEFVFSNGWSLDVRVLKKLDEVVMRFNEFLLRVSVLKMNPYMRNFFEKLLEIEKTCKQVIEIVNEFQLFQNKWIYLSSIFQTASLSESLSYELKIWNSVDRFFKNNIKLMFDQPQVFKQVQRDGFITLIRKQNTEIDNCREGLNRFLEQKRQQFPRLYFLSNEELLMIYGKQSEIIDAMVLGDEKSFINVIYQGIINLKFNKQKEICGIVARDGEEITLNSPVSTKMNIEKWLQNLDTMSCYTMKKHILFAYMDMDLDLPIIPEEPKELRNFKKSDKFQVRKVNADTLRDWIAKWPGQATYLSLQIWFANKIQIVFQGAMDKAKQVDQMKRQRKQILQIGRPPGQESDSSSENSDLYKSHHDSGSDNGDAIDEMEEARQTVMSSVMGGQDTEPDQLEMGVEIQPDAMEAEGPDDQESRQASANNQPGVAKHRSRLSVCERAMRFWDKFCVNDVQHPAEALQDIKSGVLQKIRYMLVNLNNKLELKTYNSTVALITGCVHQRDQIQHMIDNRQFKVTDFEWEIQFKFVLDRLASVFKLMYGSDLDKPKEEIEKKLDFPEVEVRCEVFNLVKQYGFQYLGNASRLVITPLTLKAQRSMLMAMQFQFACTIEGPFGTGKTETVKDLANGLARPSHVINTSTEFEYSEVLKYMKGVVASGSWVLFDEFNRMEVKMMNYITQVITQIQNAVRGQVKLIYIDEQKVSIDFEAAIFITMNPGYAGRVELPVNLKNLFRPIQMVVPDWSLITEILLSRSGFYKAHELSKKMTQVQKQSNELMTKHSHVKKDFGLRAIRAIIHIAECLKRQCQNLQVSEMPDIINEHIMSKINWKEQKLISDVIAELSAEESQMMPEPQIFFGSPSNVAITTMKEAGVKSGQKLTGSQSLAQVNLSSSKMNVSNQDSNQQNQNIALDHPNLQNQLSQMNMSENQPQTNFQGPFFDAAFKSPYTRQYRQIQSLYHQIGIEGMNPSEEELEECIIVKALRDFNQAKFAETDHAVINSIITDVFSSEIHRSNSSNIIHGGSSVASMSQLKGVSPTQSSDYGNLRELLQQHMLQSKLDHNPTLELKCYQLYEVIQVKVGCIVLGEPQAAKTTLTHTLAGALNYASHNELKLRIAQVRKERLIASVLASHQVSQLLPAAAVKRLAQQIRLAQKMNSNGQLMTAINTFTSEHKMSATNFSGQSIEQLSANKETGSNYTPYKTKKAKLSEKQKTAVWQDLYTKTRLDRIEIFALEQELVLRGVKVKRINPKSISKSELIGEVIGNSGIWNEGLLTQALRQYSLDVTTQKKWVHIDGPIDHDWAENLNSVLDENRKINLPNGDVININSTTNLIFETDSVRNLTPATISRCGLVHLNRPSLNRPKQIFNQYLNRIPPNLSENVKEIESQVNWLMPSCFQIFNEEKVRGTLLMPAIDEYWVVQSFIKVFDSFLQSYWIDFINGQKSDWEDATQQTALRNCLKAHGYPEQPPDIVGLVQEDTVKLDPEVLEAEFIHLKIQSATNMNDPNLDQRIAHNDFTTNDTRVENSLKFLPLWIEAFILVAINMTFGPIMDKKARDRLSDQLKVKYEERKGDFATYQKTKKKIQQAKDEQKKKEQKALLKAMVTGGLGATKGGATAGSGQFMQSGITSMMGASQKSSQNERSQPDLLATLQNLGSRLGLSPDFKEPSEEHAKPMFITEFPFANDFGCNLFDYFFNLDNNQWTRFDDQAHQAKMYLNFNSQSYSQQCVQTLAVPTIQWVKLYYLMECLVIAQKPILVCGHAATGKSTLIKDMLFSQTATFTKSVLVDHISCTYRTTNDTLKDHVSRNLLTHSIKIKKETQDDFNDSDTERPMQSYKTGGKSGAGSNGKPGSQDGERRDLIEMLNKQMIQDQEPKVMRPMGEHVQLLVYVEDVHLTNFDQFQDNSAAETLRDLLQYQRWYSSKKQSVRKVQGVNLIGCYNTSDASNNKLSLRLLRHFSVIGIELLNQDTCFAIVNRMLDIHAQQWPSQMQYKVPNISKAVFDLYKYCTQQLRPTPIKIQYTFNQREMFKLVAAICKVEGNYMKNIDNVTRLFFHESLRQYGDRILMKHDLKWFVRTLKAVCCKHFYDKDVSTFDFTKILHIEDNDDDPMFENFPVKDPDNLWFSVLNDEVEGYYLESNQPKKIRDIIERQTERYNELPDLRKLNLVLYDELYRHLFKIVRAINLHGGHLIVVGLRGFATGELIKLATFIAGKTYSTLEMHPEFSDQDWKQELRFKIIETGQDDKPICFVLEEYRMTNQDWYRDIETLMTCNTLTQVFAQSDMSSILSALKLQHRRLDRQRISDIEGGLAVDGVAAAQENDEKEDQLPASKKHISLNLLVKENMKIIQGNPNLSNELYQSLMQRTRKNLHFILTFTPSGKNFRNKMQYHQQLMHNSQIIWIQNLQSEDLMQIGEQVFIDEMEIEQRQQQLQDSERDVRLDDHVRSQARVNNTRILKSFIQVYLITLRFAKKYQEKNQHTLYFTPVFFLRSMTAYRRLLVERRRNVTDTQERYNKGLEKIKDTLVVIAEYQKEIEKKTPVLVKRQQRLVAVIVDIQAQINRASQQRESALHEETFITNDTADAKKKLDDCQYALDSIIPALNNSLAQMQKISKIEIAEVRSMQHPPRLVKLVMKAICILLDVEPIMKKTKDGKQKLSYWRAAISTQVLADPNLPERLETFDRSRLSSEKMQIVEELMSDPDYSLAAIKKSALAAENLYGWVKALRDYHYIFRELEPRKTALLESERSYEKANNRSGSKRGQIQSLEQNLDLLKQLMEEKTSSVQELKDEIEDQVRRKRRADNLLRCLHAEKQKWVVCQRLLDTNSAAVNGDVVLAAAILNYGGGFAFSYRRQLIEKWQAQALVPFGLNTTVNFQLQELFGDNFKIRDWHANGLSKDILSTDNALIMEKTRLYITAIDPQQQASIWLKAQYASAGMIITKLSDPNFKRTLEVAIDMGKLVMVENVPERVDIHIESLVKQEITKFQDTRMIKFCRKTLKMDPEFGLIIVTNLQKPHYDVNLTNYTTLVNFCITVEGLSQNLLTLVVANERKDLEDDFNNAMDQTFNSVKNLKQLENKMLEQLETQTPHEILSDDAVIEQLRESAKTSESIAANLRKIQQTNEFLEKSRVIYTPVAFRAATLYYGIQELHHVNTMYKFGLSWFLTQFSAMMKMVNQLNKPKPASKFAAPEPHKVIIQNEEFVIVDVKLSPEYRVNLLMNSFTQEIIRKVIFSVFQEDRQFITYFLAMRILQAEQLTDDNLISFSMAGSKQVTEPQAHFRAMNQLPWLTEVVWSDLQYLQTMRPFTQEILSSHILENQQDWNQIYLQPYMAFESLPNRQMIDLEQFAVVDIRDAIEAVDNKLLVTLTDLKSASGSNQSQRLSVKSSQGRNPTHDGDEDPALDTIQEEYTEAQILADESIWLVSEGNSDEDDKFESNKIKRNKEFYNEPSAISEEEKVMARYMVEHAPGSLRIKSDFESMHVMTRQERRSYDLRQLVLRRTVELALAKCLRPDSIQACLHQLVATIYDFNYTTFNVDVLAKFIDADGTLNIRKTLSGSTELLVMPKREKADNNIQLLIEEAFTDSSSIMPVLFLVSHSVNVHSELQTFHSNLHGGMKFNMIQCSKTAEAQFTQQIRTAMMNGDWLLVQNLHMEPSWIELVETYIQQLSAETNPRFRLWLTMPYIEGCSSYILKACVKVALQQPINIKMKIERHLQTLKEGIFRRGQETGTFHKNVYLGLCYLHGVLDGRRAYGPLGWHVVYEFDKNDFDISDSLLSLYMKKDMNNKVESLEVMKYIFSNINFAGKISRTEDQRKLQAHVEDLFNEDLTFNYETPIDMDSSHFGFPGKDQDVLEWVIKELPEQDHYKIFGYNENIFRHTQKKISLNITQQMKILNQQTLQEQGYAQVHTDLENQLKRFALERNGISEGIDQPQTLLSCFVKLQRLLTQSSLDQTLAEDGDRYDERIDKSLLPKRDENDRAVSECVAQIKQLLELLLYPQVEKPLVERQTPVQYCLEKELEQYQNLRDVMLQTVDEFMIFVEGDGIMPHVTEMLWRKIQNNQMPQAWRQASYDTARESLAHYLADFVEKIKFWNEVITSEFSTKVYMVSAFYDVRQFLIAKILSANTKGKPRSLQNKLTVTQFMDPRQAEEAFKDSLKEGKSSLLYGLWLEGAEWDPIQQILVEQRDFKIHARFPVLELTQVQADVRPVYDEDEVYFNDNPPLSKQENKEKAKQKKLEELARQKKLPSTKFQSKAATPKVAVGQTPAGSVKGTPMVAGKQPVQSMEAEFSQQLLLMKKVYVYKCPVFATTNRLSLGGVGQENKPLFYVELRSHDKPRKWVKRSVALLLEPNVLE